MAQSRTPRSLHSGSIRGLVLLAILLVTLSATAQDFSLPQQTKSDPSAPLIQQANDALAAGDFPAALKLLTTLNTQTPHNAQVLYDLGLTTEALAETPSAAAPTSPQPATAESFYRAAIDANPLFPDAHVALGLLLARTARAPEARTQLRTAIQIPDTPAPLKGRALRALAQLDLTGQPEPASAAADLLAALQLTPETPDDILLSARISESGPTPDLPSAEQAYRRYLALPSSAADLSAISALAHVLLAQHHPAEAESLLTPALTAHPGDPTLTAQLASAELASGDPAQIAKATPLLESLHTSNPADPNITRLLARVYLETGHPDQADTLYAALIATQFRNGTPVDPTLLDDRAETLIRLHRPGEAETLLKQAIANPAAFPTPAALAEAATHLAFAAAEIDDPRTTLQALALRSTVLPPSPSTLYLEATANDTLHQSSKALNLYAQFLTSAQGNYPDQEKQARQRVAALQQKK